MAEIGHNRGPSLDAGHGFRKVAWTHARAALLPSLPLEVVRLRVKRAERLGLPYKAYATIRAVSGRDIVGFLFSDNALEMRGRAVIPAAERARLDALEGAARRLAAIHLPVDPVAVLQGGGLEAAGRAPGLDTSWSQMRAGLRQIARNGAVPVDGLIVVTATALERGWCDAAGLGGSVPRETVFGQ